SACTLSLGSDCFTTTQPPALRTRSTMLEMPPPSSSTVAGPPPGSRPASRRNASTLAGPSWKVSATCPDQVEGVLAPQDPQRVLDAGAAPAPGRPSRHARRVRGRDHVVEVKQRVGRHERFPPEYVDARSADPMLREHDRECVLV